jgi:hypothetical protein
VGNPVYEDIGPLPLADTGGLEGVYRYPNPHERVDLHPDCDWYYKELIAIINTHTLPSDYALYNFELELLGNTMNNITGTITDPDGTGLGLKMLVDNIPPTGSLGDIIGPGGQVAEACGFLHLPCGVPRTQVCDGSPNTRICSSNSELTVPFSVNDPNGNLHSFSLAAYWGCSESEALMDKNYHDDAPAKPVWNGGDYSADKTRAWDQCAYQFRLYIWKRVTDGVDPHTIEAEFTKHITIIVDTP